MKVSIRFRLMLLSSTTRTRGDRWFLVARSACRDGNAMTGTVASTTVSDAAELPTEEAKPESVDNPIDESDISLGWLRLCGR